MEFLNYCKNHFKYKIYKIILYIIIGIVLMGISGFINIATVHASDIICYDTGNEYDFQKAFLNIWENDGSNTTVSEEILKRTYLEALEDMKKNYGFESYIVSLSVSDGQPAESFVFTFKENIKWEGGNKGTKLLYIKGISYTYSLSEDGMYTFSSSEYEYGGNYYLGNDYWFNVTGTTCESNSLLLFAGNYIKDFSGLLDGILMPTYGTEYTHVDVGGDIHYIADDWIPEIQESNLVELSLDTAPWLVLYLKDYETAEPFTTNMFFKGMVCPQPVFEYGTAVKEDFSDRCTVDLTSYTKKEFSVLKTDIDNHAVYYFKGYKEGAFIKFNANLFNYKYIYDEKNPILNINGTDYNILSYNSEDIPGNAIENEDNNVAPGESTNFFDNILDGIKAIFRSITSFFNGFFTKLKELFIPESNYFSNWFTDFKTFFEVKLGFLATPFTIIIDFLDYYLDLNSNDEIIIDIPDITIPNFEEHKIISATTFNWSELLNSKAAFKNIWTLYLDFIDVFLILKFIGLCHNKYNRIFGGDVVNDN